MTEANAPGEPQSASQIITNRIRVTRIIHFPKSDFANVSHPSQSFKRKFLVWRPENERGCEVLARVAKARILKREPIQEIRQCNNTIDVTCVATQVAVFFDAIQGISMYNNPRS